LYFALKGPIKSPQILILSGIGPKHYLDYLGIPVKADLPVGKNHKDHLYILEIYANGKDPNMVISPNPPPVLTIPDLYQLYANKSGVLSQLPFALTYYSTKYDRDKSWPSTILWTTAGQKFGTDFTAYAAKFEPSIQTEWLQYYSQFTSKSVLTFVPFVGRTKSAGTICLNSTNPFDPPIIDPKFLSDDRDLKNFIEVTRLAFIAIENSSLSSYVTLPSKPIPGCSYCPNKPVHKCDRYLKCLIKQIGLSRGTRKVALVVWDQLRDLMWWWMRGSELRAFANFVYAILQ
jgi:choline dehydrogenase